MTKEISNFTKIYCLQKMAKLIYNQSEIKIPNIAVVGPQSCGKSSVLENIIGMDIFPTGSDLTTKCPIVLNLFNSETLEIKIKDKTFESSIQAKEEIADLMRKLGDIISPQPIYVEIYSPNTINMTLLDLPGLVKISKDNQPNDLDTLTLDVVKKYIEEPQTHILAIIDGTVDISNSEALKVAKQVDKLGERTIGVVTKLDLIEKKNSVVDLLNNNIIFLKYGYIGLINRNQPLEENETLKSVIENLEKDFLKENPIYTKNASENFGIEVLRKKISQIFLQFGEVNYLFTLKLKIQAKLQSLKVDYSESYTKTQVINSFYKTVVKLIDELDYKNSLFNFTNQDSFDFYLKKSFRFENFDEISPEKLLKKELENSSSFFISEKILKKVFLTKAKELNVLILTQTDRVTNELIKRISSIDGSYSKLTNNFINIAINNISEQQKKLIQNLNEHYLVSIEYLNYEHPDFDFSSLVLEYFEAYKNTYQNYQRKIQNDELQLDLLFKLTCKYYNIFKNSFVDYSLKCVFYFYIFYLKNDFFYKLNESFNEIAEEEIVCKMNNIKEEIDVLEKALEDLKIFNF